ARIGVEVAKVGKRSKEIMKESLEGHLQHGCTYAHTTGVMCRPSYRTGVYAQVLGAYVPRRGQHSNFKGEKGNL
ncbi:hypothetical protein PIB30_058262, partial [Stylosanthes scabra]|nr:hypothetical protein [Stylosanthes scabra]